ncbi:hypothetical protein [Teredinibacter purpureus]|uniref:hypothetical protein n=1 Tax=Teredinibacter purpureus TaxID=2731756 RepID=UPI0013C438D2|nr:hypothetical protein [Teredinibacter purpureus]
MSKSPLVGDFLFLELIVRVAAGRALRPSWALRDSLREVLGTVSTLSDCGI